MPKYICKNTECLKYDQEQLISKSKISFINGEKFDAGSICQECSKTMESINPAGFTTHMTGSENICKK